MCDQPQNHDQEPRRIELSGEVKLQSPKTENWWKSSWPSIGSLVVAIVAIGTSCHTTNRTLSHTTEQEFAKLQLDYRLRQVNELYGPLYFLIDQDRGLHDQLRIGKPNDWHLRQHIKEVMDGTNSMDRALVSEIMTNDQIIEQLILTKGGLITSPKAPASFDAFLVHYRVLKAALAGKESSAMYPEYPTNLDDDVYRDYTNMLNEIRFIWSKHSPISSSD